MAPASLVRRLMGDKKSSSAPARRVSSSTSTKRKAVTRRKKKRPTKRKTAATSTAKTAHVPAKPMGDKVEYSPTSRAKCQGCNKKIQQGQQRIGKEEFYPQTQGYIHRYYHLACYQQQFPDAGTTAAAAAASSASLNLPSQRSIAEELQHAQQQRLRNQGLLQQRAALRQQLQRLRQVFAKRLKRNEFLVFPDATLDDLVLKLPRNQQEMLRIHGIAETRYRNFGLSILQVIAQHAQSPTPAAVAAASIVRRATTTATTTKAARMSATPAATTTVVTGAAGAAVVRQRQEPPQMRASSIAAPRMMSASSASTAAVAGRATAVRRQREIPRMCASEIILIDCTDNDDDTDTDDDDKHDDNDDDDDQDDDVEEDEEEGMIMMGKSLSCEEIVQQKFDHAAKNNYIISID